MRRVVLRLSQTANGIEPHLRPRLVSVFTVGFILSANTVPFPIATPRRVNLASVLAFEAWRAMPEASGHAWIFERLRQFLAAQIRQTTRRAILLGLTAVHLFQFASTKLVIRPLTGARARPLVAAAKR